MKPINPFTANLPKKAAKKIAKKPTASEEAFELARIRAALPIEKGGLGLPINNTAADRAAAMGFTKDTYHGSLYDIPKFEIRKASTESHAGKGVYSTSNPEDASLNYASVYGPDPKAKIERSAERRDRYPKFSLAALEEEGLTPRRQEVLASNAINAENLGVVYPLKVRADQSVHIDKPEADVLKVGPFERFDEATERYVDTEGTPTFRKALDEFSALGGEPNDIYDFVQNYGDELGRVSASDLFNAVKKSAQSTVLIDPNTDDYVSGGVAAANFLKHFGVDEIRHTPSFNNQQLNIAKEHTISLNPENVRSRFAAFDPFRKSSAVAAALGVAAPDLMAEEIKEHEKKAAGGAIKKVAKALTASERKANLDKFLEPSAVQMRLYHGTGATEGGKGQEAIRQFKPSKEGALGSGTYLTPQPILANTYGETPGGYVLPVYAQLKNPLILRQKSPDRYKDPMIEALELLGMDSEKAAKMVERAYETKGYIGKEVESRAKAAGYDGLLDYDRHGNLSEVVSYNPSAIKSALGNEGTYDTSTPLLNKAEGGLIRMQDGGDPTQMFNFNPMAAKAAAQERMRREAAEANRYKSVMGSTPQDLLRRIEPEPAQMTETPRSAMPTTIDRAVVSGLQFLGAPKSQARGINQLLDKSVGMFVPDPERLYHEASEAAKKGDLYELITGPGLEATLGYMPLIGSGAKFAMPAIKAAGREVLRPIDSAMFGQGPLADVLRLSSPMNVTAPVSRLGFYDPVEEAGLNLKRKQGPGQAFLNELQRAENVNKQFLEQSGIAERLRTAPNITREEVQAMTKGAVPEVKEIVLGSNVVPPSVIEFAKVHLPDFNPSNKDSIAKLIQVADQRYQKAMAEGDLDIAEFAEQAETEAKKLASQYESGSKPADRLSKYAEYQLPGGKNYREVLLTVPTQEPRAQFYARKQADGTYEVIEKNGQAPILIDLPDYETAQREIANMFGSGKLQSESVFRGQHWQDPNVVSHIRMNDRTDYNGKKVLFIEEMQSDWAQQGRKHGFKDDPTLEDQFNKLAEEHRNVVAKRSELVVDPQRQDEYKALADRENVLLKEMNKLHDAKQYGPPTGPFIKNTNEWVDLSLKNIIKRAVDEGYDRVAFINGKQSADRYDLANYVDNITWNNKPQNEIYKKYFPEHKSVVINTQNGNPIKLFVTREGIVKSSFDKQFDDKKLDDVVGKDIARKIMADESGSLGGQGLSVGGEGMKKFYDQIVPDRLRKLVGKDNVKHISGAVRDDVPQPLIEYNARRDRYEVFDARSGNSMDWFDTFSDAEDFVAKIESIPVPPQLGFDITPEIREKFSQPIPYKHGGVVKMAAGGAKKLKRAAEAIAKFQDPQATKIQEWQWKPLEVNQQLKLAEVPDYIQRGYGDFMIEQAKRAASGNLGVRDLIKAYGITQSSIGRGGLSYETATKAGLKVPKGEGLVRPEGAFAEWLGSKQGQKFLDDAERGVVNEKALDDIRAKFAPFGKANQLTEQLRYGVNNMSTLVPKMQQALVGTSDEYRDWAESIKGIAGAKSGFIGSMLGRGDLPTLDARQLNLHALDSPVAPQTMMQRGKGLGAREAVDRLAARQSALGLDIDPSLDPYYQHLAHHAVWDKVADEKTTHEDLMRALRGYKEGGEPDTDAMRLEMMRKSWRSK